MLISHSALLMLGIGVYFFGIITGLWVSEFQDNRLEVLRDEIRDVREMVEG